MDSTRCSARCTSATSASRAAPLRARRVASPWTRVPRAGRRAPSRSPRRASWTTRRVCTSRSQGRAAFPLETSPAEEGVRRGVRRATQSTLSRASSSTSATSPRATSPSGAAASHSSPLRTSRAVYEWFRACCSASPPPQCVAHHLVVQPPLTEHVWRSTSC